MIDSAQGRLTVSFDGNSWYASDAAGDFMALPVGDGQWLPELPEGFVCEQLLLPIEQLLVRTFSLPLPNPRLVDAEILGQELDDRAGIEPDHWWLSWQADKSQGVDGETPVRVAGVVFGLPDVWKEAIVSDPTWQKLRFIGVDAWERLYDYVTEATDNTALVVFDSDQQGVFFGLWLSGICCGVRRSNWQGQDAAAMSDEIGRSLAAMGGNQTRDYVAMGLLDDALLQALALPDWRGAVKPCGDLPDRHAANMARLTASSLARALNFRHGRWSAVSGFTNMHRWKRAIILAVALLLMWLTGSVYQNYNLNQQVTVYQQQVMHAFHQGLPDEKVVIDALAQLRSATDNGSGASAPSGRRWLQQLAIINKVYKQTPWDMRELEWREGVMKMSGRAGSLQELNTIRQALQQQTATEVRLLDTDLNGQQVNFRMEWL